MMSDWIRFDGGLLYGTENVEFFMKDGTVADYDDAYYVASDIIAYRKKEPVKTEYTGVCWAYHYEHMAPKMVLDASGRRAFKGTYIATHIDGKLKSITWEADK